MESLPLKEKVAINFNAPEELVSFIDNTENGYIKNKKFGKVTYISILKPVDYMLAQKKISDSNKNYKKSDFEDLQYFDLRIKIEDFKMEFIKYDLSSTGQYQERINYCAFNMQNDISLIDGKDTLNCVLYHFERAFDVIPYGHFILGFENKNKKSINAKTLCFDDKLFNNGIIKFTYSPSFLAKEPTLL
ncbi:MAG: hypothetical protein H0W73_04860 [Bacteroidetes bacterium]|nr:hypothetical protein [Bacteroidota bacterium]